MTDSYLVGARFSIDDNELSKYLADVEGKLMGSYLEHHICAALYTLADKFDQLFDPTRFSVSISSYSEIPTLIREMKNGEQVVLDDLQDIADNLRDYASGLQDGSLNRDEVLKSIDYHREQIKRYRDRIKKKRREILLKL